LGLFHLVDFIPELLGFKVNLFFDEIFQKHRVGREFNVHGSGLLGGCTAEVFLDLFGHGTFTSLFLVQSDLGIPTVNKDGGHDSMEVLEKRIEFGADIGREEVILVFIGVVQLLDSMKPRKTSVLDECSTMGVQKERAKEDRVDIGHQILLDEKKVGNLFNCGDKLLSNFILEVFSLEFCHLADCFFHGSHPGFCGLFNFCGEHHKIIGLHDAIGSGKFKTESRKILG